MEKTSINTVYVLIHCIANYEAVLDTTETGYVTRVYFREDDAELDAQNLNSNFGGEYTMNGVKKHQKWIVVERNIY